MIFFVMTVLALVLSLLYKYSGIFPAEKKYINIFYETFFMLMLGYGLHSAWAYWF